MYKKTPLPKSPPKTPLQSSTPDQTISPPQSPPKIISKKFSKKTLPYWNSPSKLHNESLSDRGVVMSIHAASSTVRAEPTILETQLDSICLTLAKMKNRLHHLPRAMILLPKPTLSTPHHSIPLDLHIPIPEIPASHQHILARARQRLAQLRRRRLINHPRQFSPSNFHLSAPLRSLVLTI